MRYRKLGGSTVDPATGFINPPTYDYVFGHSLQDFWIDVPDAPAQAVLTRLELWQGQWFLNTADGMPWTTKVLGKYTGSVRDAAVRARTLGTRDVTAILAYASQLNPNTRHWSVQMTIDTSFGRANVVAASSGVPPFPFPPPVPPSPPTGPTWDDGQNWDDAGLVWGP